MDDIRTVVKELRRIADAGERIAKAMEKQNYRPSVNLSLHGDMTEGDVRKVKQWVKEAIEQSVENRT